MMVWTENFIVEDELVTLEGFSDEKFSFIISLPIPVLEEHNLFRFRLAYFKDTRDMLRLGFHFIDEKKFPKHFIFANFQCLRCGLCCKNYECVPVEGYQVMKWESEGKEDILRYVVVYARLKDGTLIAEIYPRGFTGCPLCRKVKNKPYYYCKIHSAKEHLPVCKAYLCSKSIPVAHLKYSNIDELIEMTDCKSIAN